VVRLRQALPEVRPGGTYRLSAWIRHQGVQEQRRSIGLRLRWRGRVEEYAAKAAQEGEWERWERVIRVADGAEEVAVELMLQWTGGTVWFSGVGVEATEPARRPVRVASVYWRPQTRSAVDANLGKFCSLVDRAADAGAQIVCLPETLLGIGTGGPGPIDAMPIPGPATDAFEERARLRKIWICAGLSERAGDRIYNSAVLIDRKGNLIGKYRKTHLPIQEVEAGFTPGRELPVFDTEFGKIGMLICHDTAFPEPARVLALKGAELVLLPIWGGADLYVRPRAAENGFFIVSSSYDYPCGVISPTGQWLCQSAKEPEGSVVTCDIDLEQSQRTVEYEGRFHGNHRRERNPLTYGELLKD
jgi:predicted amidohydrolase